LRVIAGVAKGRKLKNIRGLDIRPPLDQVKESTFDILGQLVQDARVLDLFAGTGSLGIEALSRGCQRVIFVDKEERAVRLIEENLERVGLADPQWTTVLKMDALAAVRYLDKKGEKFDLIFVDPPYKIGKGILEALFYVLSTTEVLKDEGEVILKIPLARRQEMVLAHFSPIKERRFGQSTVLFLSRKPRSCS
jgi:16S rRNA (guanine(966)-N(2))-methyltransferase RsmD